MPANLGKGRGAGDHAARASDGPAVTERSHVTNAEFTNAVFRRMPHLQTGQVFAMADEIGSFGTAPVSIETVAQARTLRLANGFSWWDCLLLASAAELGCSHFLSEDLHDGQKIGAMTVVDPFLHDPADILGA